MSASQRRIHTVAYLAAATLLASGSLGIAASAANAATAPASTTAEGAKTASQAPTNRSLHPRKASKGRLAVKVSGLPASTNSRVVVSGTSKSTKRYLETLTGSAQLTNLRAGQYRVHAYGTTVGDATYSPKTAIKNLTVKRSGTTRYTVKYKKVARDCTPGPYKNLTNCDFSAQALDNANFAKSTLTNASFAAASVRGANFGMANLTGVDFSNSLLARASFNGAKLANATLANVELTQASFLGASSGGVIGRPLPTDCGDLAFNCPRFDDVYNGYIIATGVNLQGADLADIDLSPWSNLQGVDFTDADLTGANLRGSGVQSAIFVRTKLNSAILDQTAAQYANFNGADLTAANINHFYAQHASFVGATIVSISCPDDGPVWTYANLSGANLQNAVLAGTNTGADLVHANLTGTDLSGAVLTAGDLRHAVLVNTNLNDTNLATASFSSPTNSSGLISNGGTALPGGWLISGGVLMFV